jgi:hypothetical protein
LSPTRRTVALLGAASLLAIALSPESAAFAMVVVAVSLVAGMLLANATLAPRREL